MGWTVGGVDMMGAGRATTSSLIFEFSFENGEFWVNFEGYYSAYLKL